HPSFSRRCRTSRTHELIMSFLPGASTQSCRYGRPIESWISFSQPLMTRTARTTKGHVDCCESIRLHRLDFVIACDPLHPRDPRLILFVSLSVYSRFTAGSGRSREIAM